MFASAARGSWRRAAFAAILITAPPVLGQTPAKTPAPPPRLRIEIGACEHALWANMPGGMSSNVELANAGTTPECAALALGSTRQALTASSVLSAAARSTSFTVELLSKLNPWGLPADVAAKVLQAALESGGTLEGFSGQLGEKAMEQLANTLGGAAGGHGPGGTAAREKVVGEFAEQAFKYFRGSEFVQTHTDRFHGMTCDGEFTVIVTASFLEARGEVRIVANGAATVRRSRAASASARSPSSASRRSRSATSGSRETSGSSRARSAALTTTSGPRAARSATTTGSRRARRRRP